MGVSKFGESDDAMRIRSIKPEFFTHEGLFDLEKEYKLPMRVAFAGLWCACDREGRFKWEPRRLGIAILPYDGIDFSRVLDALSTRGFVLKYRVERAWFGVIPSWKKHQFINNKETPSDIPNITQAEEVDASGTREGHVEHAIHKEGKGKEGKGSNTPLPPSDPNPSDSAGKPPAGDDRHHAITSQWNARYLAFHGIAYAFQGRDPPELKRLLKLVPDSAEEILNVAEQAWQRAKTDRFVRHCKQAATIFGLCTAYNQIRVELKTPQAGTQGTLPIERIRDQASIDRANSI